METENIQVRFFQHIKSLIPSHIALVDDVADLLSISTDSAYRRIRGEKPMTIDETALLCAHYKVSMDQFLHLGKDSFIFSGKLANASDHVFEKWMEDALKQLQFMNSYSRKHMIYLAKDIPLFAQFLVPEVTAFKSFLWRKSILHYSELKGVKFSLDKIEEKHIALGKQMAEVYNQIPATDIWNVESINSTIRQIEYYRDAGVFEKDSDVTRLYDAVIKLIDHLEKQAELGVKFAVGGTPKSNAAAFHMYNNELVLGDNTVCVELDDKKITYLTHSAINYIYTTDETFNEHIYNALQNIIRKSSHLSEVGEKERVRFFNKIRNKITSVSL